MNTRTHNLTARLVLAAALAFGAAGTVLASDIDPAAISQVSQGESQDAVRAALGEPTKHNHYLFAQGSSDLYYIAGGSLGNEWVLQINYDANDRVISSQRINAGFFDLNRF
jgi:outer membrane protein assembly factor BamE (lipoprotein component of BamABCDE complex)